jgi:hypothetical protein
VKHISRWYAIVFHKYIFSSENIVIWFYHRFPFSRLLRMLWHHSSDYYSNLECEVNSGFCKRALSEWFKYRLNSCYFCVVNNTYLSYHTYQMQYSYVLEMDCILKKIQIIKNWLSRIDENFTWWNNIFLKYAEKNNFIQSCE